MVRHNLPTNRENVGGQRPSLTTREPSTPITLPSTGDLGPGWSVTESPNASASEQDTLSGAACASPTECWAVGSYESSGYSQTLIEKWDGNSWTIFSSPNTGSNEFSALKAVTCISASQCWAVGSGSIDGFRTPLLEQWNGTVWSIVSSAVIRADLYGVACTSTTNCWATGSAGYYGSARTLIEHWDGNSWTVVSSPSPTSVFVVLRSITCASTGECWAVGSYTNGSDPYLTLIEHWDGNSWTIVPSPNAPSGSNDLIGVTCAATSNCWTVGEYQSDTPNLFQQTLVEHWDGVSWTIAASPNTSGMQRNYLYSVTCNFTDDCWAVGNYLNESIGNQTLIEHWDGASWQIVMSPNRGQDNYLYAVACVSAAQCWTVGYYYANTATLIERYNALKVASIARLGNQHVVLQCYGVPNRVNAVKVSPDLDSPFTLLSSVVAAADGTFQFEDVDAGSFASRFYELSFP